MPDIYEVSAETALNLRERPVDGDVITALPSGHDVTKVGESDVDGWWRVSTQVMALQLEGFVSSKYLKPMEVKKPRFRVRFSFGDLDASYDRVKSFVGQIAEDFSPQQLPQLEEILSEHGIINTRKRFAHFMAQLAHESQGFMKLEENLNYSAERILEVFPSKFKTLEEAQKYAHNPKAFGNRVYAGVNGNGDEASGDGYRYRGRGFIHLTGRGNYKEIGALIGEDLVTNPDRAADPLTALKIAAAYWSSKNLNDDADRNDLEAVTKKVNGGFNGLKHRRQLLERARDIWG